MDKTLKVLVLGTALSLLLASEYTYAECSLTAPGSGIYLCPDDDLDGIDVSGEDGVSVTVAPDVEVINPGGTAIAVGETSRIVNDGGLVGTDGVTLLGMSAGANSEVEIFESIPGVSEAVVVGDAGDGTAVEFRAPVGGDPTGMSNSLLNQAGKNGGGGMFGDVVSNGNVDTSITNEGLIVGDITTTGGADTFNNVDGAVVDGNIAMGGGDDTLSIDDGSLVIGDVDMGEGNNLSTVDGVLDGNLSSGAGNDVVDLGVDAVVTGDVDNGDGVNTTTLAADATIGGSLSNGSGDDSVTLGAGASVDGGIDNGDGNNATTINGGNTASVDGGSGNDTVTVGAGSTVGPDGMDLGDGTNQISNAGDITGDIIMGSGDDTITATGVGTIDGNIEMGAGINTVTFDTDGQIPSGTLNADPAGTNTLNLGGNAGPNTYDVLTTNFDTLNKNGTGEWILDEDNSFDSSININAGTLTANGTSRFGDNTIVNNAAAVIDEAAAGTYSGDMSGTGTLTKTGAGASTLSGTNTYTGQTTVSEGTLIVDGGAAINDIGAVVVEANTTFQVDAAETIGSLASADPSLVQLNANLTTGGNNTSTAVAGTVDGAGGFTKEGTGNMTLSGVNTYTGTTTVNGGSVTLEGGAAIEDTADVVIGVNGQLVVNASETIDALSGAGAVGIADAQVLSASSDGSDSTYSGAISGLGGLEKLGAGTLTLNGVNSYAGGTEITAGTLAGTTSGIQGAVNGAAGSTLRLDNSVLLANGTMAGDITGTLDLEKAGSQTIALSGTNTFTGDVTVNGGLLSIDDDARLGDVANDVFLNGGGIQTSAAVTSDRDVFLPGNGQVDTLADTTLNGAITGVGDLTKTGGATLTLTGANTYSGGTTISAGTLAGEVGPIQGDILNNASLLLDVDAAAADFAGNISGVGQVTKTGAEELRLSGTNTYSGGTTVSGGTLIGDTTGVQGNIANNAAVVFDMGADGTYSGNMSGTGTVEKIVAGTNLTMTGTNSYTGGTTVTEGTLTGHSASLQGDIVTAVDTEVIFNQAANGAFAGDISGDGLVSKQGAGTLDILAASTFTQLGNTFVEAGGLAVNGSIVGDVTLDVGTTLSGIGSIEGNVVANGTTGPGNSQGTIDIIGDFTFGPNAVFDVELDADGSDVMNVTGTATLDGTMALDVDRDFYDNAIVYNVLNAGATAGTFDTVTGEDVNLFVDITTSYVGGDTVSLATGRRDYVTAAITGNQAAVAAALDRVVAAGGVAGDVEELLTEIDYLPNDVAAAAAFGSLGPQDYSALLGGAIVAGDAFADTVKRQLRGRTPDTRGLWAQAYGAQGEVDSDGALDGYDIDVYGVAVGFDFGVGENGTLGVVGGYSSTDAEPDNSSDGEHDNYQIGGYYGTDFGSGNWGLDILGYYAKNDADFDRPIFVGDEMAIASSDTDSDELRAAGYLTYKMGNFAPYGGLDYSTITVDSFSETGAGVGNLSVDDIEVDRFFGELGVRYESDREGIRPIGYLGYRYDFNDDDVDIDAVLLGESFQVSGAKPDEGAAVYGVGIEADTSDTLKLFLVYDGKYSDEFTQNQISGGLYWIF